MPVRKRDRVLRWISRGKSSVSPSSNKHPNRSQTPNTSSVTSTAQCKTIPSRLTSTSAPDIHLSPAHILVTEHILATDEPPKGRLSKASGLGRSHSTNYSGQPSPEFKVVEPLDTPSAADSDPIGPTQKSLWEKAIENLDTSNKDVFAEFTNPRTHEMAKILQETRDNIEKMLVLKRGQAWKIQINGDEVVLRDIGMKILQWVDKFKAIGDVVVQYDPGHAALPWALFRFLLQVCVDRQETIDGILMGFEKIGYIINRCAVYERLYLGAKSFASTTNLETSLVCLYTTILQYMAKAMKSVQDTMWKSIFTTDSLSGFFTSLDRMQRIVEDNATAARDEHDHMIGAKLISNTDESAKNFTKLVEILDDLSVINSTFNVKLDGIKTMLEGTERLELLQWLSSIPYTNHHQRISDSRLEGSGDWILARKEYKEWRSSSASKLLLLRGIPGAGKTYIASKIIDTVLREKNSEKLVYFYCNRAESDRCNPETILNTLIQQLSQVDNKNILEHVVQIYENRKSKGQTNSRLTLKESQDLLVKLTDMYPLTIICVDALDEVDYQTRLHLLKSLKQVVEKSTSLVKIFATARNDPDIVIPLGSFPRIELEPDDNAGDINEFINERLDSVIDDQQLLFGHVSDHLKEDMRETLCHRSKGMFQLAALQIKFLCHMSTEADVREGLTQLPDTLTSAYDTIFAQIKNQNDQASRLAINAFRWIKFSRGPLAIDTLVDAISYKVTKDEDFYHSEGPILVEMLLKICQNFVVLDKGLGVFRFAHLSVEEYLDTGLELNEHESHVYITDVCLSLLCEAQYLDKYNLPVDGCLEEEDYQTRNLLLYSTVFWPWHFWRAVERCNTKIWDNFLSRPNYERWLETLSKISPGLVHWDFEADSSYWNKMRLISETEKQDIDFLVLACICGFSKFFRTVLNSCSSTTRLGREIVWSSQFGHRDVVMLLLDHGASACAVDKFGRTALHLATHNGYENIARLLLEHGASACAVDEDGTTPLHEASCYRHETVARLLLEHGASACAVDTRNGYTPLHEASINGDERIARLLLDNGALACAVDKDGRTPLHGASRYRHETVARLLLEHGASACAVDTRNGYTPLHEASINGDERIARLLLEHGASACAVEKYGRTALLVASRYGHETVARLLLEYGASACTVDENGETPLHAASYNGNPFMVKLLLENGASTCAVNWNGKTPLEVAKDRKATEKDMEEEEGYKHWTNVVKILENHGASMR